MIRIRYKTDVFPIGEAEARLNAYGHEQWELASSAPFILPDGVVNLHVVFKQFYDDGEPDPTVEDAARRKGSEAAMRMRG